jgi:hypothetical protein
MHLKDMISERVAASKAKRRLQEQQQTAQMAAINAIEDEAVQEQENQVIAEQQIRSESSQRPINYGGLKASKRKAIGESFQLAHEVPI